MTSRADSLSAAAPGRRLSAVLSALCVVAIIAFTALYFAILALMPEVATEGLDLPSAGDGESAPTFTAGQRLIIVVVGLVPAAFVVYALVCARRCFRSFMRGDYFTPVVVRSLRGVAAGIVLWVLAGWLSTPLSSLLLTLGAEERYVTVKFSTSGFLTLLLAGIVWQIADIMARAAALAEENAQFV